MRAQAMEKVLRKIIKELNYVDLALVPDASDALINYMAKAEIILDRGDERAASVIREMINS